MFRDRTLIYSLAFSAFFHLSMITLFSIEMRYERKPIRYYRFDIVDIRKLTEEAPAAERTTLSLPEDPASPFAADGARAAAEHLAALPRISLPVLKFDELASMKLPEADLTLESRLPSGSSEKPRDAWARFGEEIRDLRDTLRRLPFVEDVGEGGATAAPDWLVVAPGFRAEVQWLGEPSERAVVLPPAVDPQYLVDPGSLAAPMEILFRVTPDGRVNEVLAPVGERPNIVTGVVEALRRSRFEPITGTREQTAVFVLEPHDEGAP